tara:strand:+ start:1342 stop:1851 length:510 start_codon:yes stop_codon:yes gene_type:complete
MEKIVRNFLEIKSLDELKYNKKSNNGFYVEKVLQEDFQLNKFFYKQIGKNHYWIDRLEWSDQNWTEYVSNPNVFTFILKEKDNMAGFFELIFHKDKFEVEIAYLGLLEKYTEKNLGSFLLSEAIKESFINNVKRVWAHTCSLDHKNALNNYLSRGMKVYHTENINVKST